MMTLTHLPGIVGDVHIVAVNDPLIDGGSQGHRQKNHKYQSIHDEPQV